MQVGSQSRGIFDVADAELSPFVKRHRLKTSARLFV